MFHCIYIHIYIRNTNAVYNDTFMHVAVYPLIVMHPSLQEFPVVSLMPSEMAVWSLVHGQAPTQLF